MKILKSLGIVICGLALLAMPAFGDIISIDFGTGLAGVGGTYTLYGDGNASGTSIPIGALNVANAPVNNGTYAVLGTLSFDTRALSNSITIDGSVTINGTLVSGTLLSGTISSFRADANGIHDAIGPDAKSRELLAVLGLPTDLQFDFFGFSLTTDPGSQQITSTDIRNNSVPEPSSIMLFGVVLCGCGSLLRRRMSGAR
jgi:hypothetical protein